VAWQSVLRQLPLARRAWDMCEKEYGGSVRCDKSEQVPDSTSDASIP